MYIYTGVLVAREKSPDVNTQQDLSQKVNRKKLLTGEKQKDTVPQVVDVLASAKEKSPDVDTQQGTAKMYTYLIAYGFQIHTLYILNFL